MDFAVGRFLSTVLVLAASVPLGATGVEVYRRAEPLEIRTGVVSMSLVFGALVDVPQDCEQGEAACPGTSRFPRVYRLAFRLETRQAEEGADAALVEGKGTVYLALTVEPSDALEYEARLRETLAGLAADAFVSEFAALGPGGPPFYTVAEISRDRSWACFAGEDSRTAVRYERKIGERPDGTRGPVGTSWSSYGGGDPTDRVCDSLEAAFGGVRPEEIRTLPIPRKLRETAVVLHSGGTLVDPAWPDQLLSLPEGVGLTRKKVPERQGSGHATSFQPEGEIFRSRRFAQHVELRGETRAASLDPQVPGTNAWVSRWTLERTERMLGPMPVERPSGRESFLMALLPTLPPVTQSEGGEERAAPGTEASFQVQLDEQALIEEVGRRLDRVPVIDVETVEREASVDPVGLTTEGWVVVVCREGGKAVYGLPPFGLRSHVENAGAFCASVSLALGSESAASP